MTVTIHPDPDDRLGEAEIEPWRKVPVAIAADLAPDEQIDHRIRPINPPGRQPRLFGRAVTVRCEPPDFGAMLHVLDRIHPGEVLVIAADGIEQTAMIGEILSGHLRTLGATGLICDGAIRDVATLAGWTDFSVFARAVNPRGPTSATRGAVNEKVDIAGRQVSAGDLVIGDDDGLVALTPNTVRTRLADAKAKLALEADWVESLAAGKPITKIFGLEQPDEVEKS
jgi:regulator of RNase E activity RraA